MPQRMAVTHNDLLPSRRSADLGSKAGAFLVTLTILCGLFCFILCLIAEATRSEVRWLSTGLRGKEERYECVYSGSGKTPLLCAATSFLVLAVAMVVEHMYVAIAVSRSPPPALVTWDPSSAPAKSLTWRAAFFFITTWICFSVAEILLLIGLSVESGHLKGWWRPKQSCLAIREGLFSASGVFALTSVFLSSGLYVTALRAERMLQEQENVRREVLETSAFHESPPWSPRRPVPSAIAREDPIARQNQTEQPSLALLPAKLSFSKHALNAA